MDKTDRLSQGAGVEISNLEPDGGDRADDIHIYVFYHDADCLRRALKGRSPESFGSAFSWIDLDRLKVPPEAVIPGVDEALNRAMLSEYLGILSVQPPDGVKMVGTFTYSIPLKFSLDWALETGNDRLFLPPVDFSAIEALLPQLLPEYLYGVEFKHPLADDRGPVALLAAQQGGVHRQARGPYKGTLICSRERFLALQLDLRQSLATILGFDEQQLVGTSNPFSSGALAARAPQRAELDRRRSTYGNALERAMALHFSGEQHQRLQIRLGDLVRGLQVSRCPLLQAAHRAAFAGTLVLTFCNQPYLPVLQRWLDQARQAGLRGLLVVGFDAATMQFCQEHEIATVEAEIAFPQDLAELWCYRLEITRRILSTGLSVLLSDIDAYWLSNPMPRLQAGEAHIVASQGTYYPRDVFEKTGIVLCSGFIYYRYSALTLHCLDQLCQAAANDPDDQRVLNRWLLQQGIQWQIPRDLGRTSLPVTGSDLAFTAYDGDLEGQTSQGLRLKLLAHRDFQRILDDSVRPIVSHLYVPKQSDAKLDAYELLQCYPSLASQSELPQPLSLEEAAPSALVWLASYPRSGNTMLRTWLRQCFGLSSSSVYNDENDIGRDPTMSAVTGHRYRNWFYGHPSRFMMLNPDEYSGFDHCRCAVSGIDPIKTHGLWNHGYGRDACLYLYRDGRAALASHVHYRQSFAKDASTMSPDGVAKAADIRRELEEMIVCGRPQCGYWSDNVCTWLDDASSKRVFPLQFESSVANPLAALKQLELFLKRPILKPDPPSFRQLQDVNKSFFRRGKSAADEFSDPLLQSLFFAFEWRGMEKAGYISDYQWFVVDEKNEPITEEPFRVGARDVAIVRYIRACIDTYSVNVHAFNRASFRDKLADIAERILVRFSQQHVFPIFSSEEVNYWTSVAETGEPYPAGHQANFG